MTRQYMIWKRIDVLPCQIRAERDARQQSRNLDLVDCSDRHLDQDVSSVKILTRSDKCRDLINEGDTELEFSIK